MATAVVGVLSEIAVPLLFKTNANTAGGIWRYRRNRQTVAHIGIFRPAKGYGNGIKTSVLQSLSSITNALGCDLLSA